MSINDMITSMEAKTGAYSAPAHLGLHGAIDRHHGRETRNIGKACTRLAPFGNNIFVAWLPSITPGARLVHSLSNHTRCIYRGAFVSTTELQGRQKPTAVFIFKFGSPQALALRNNHSVFAAPNTALEHWPSYQKRS